MKLPLAIALLIASGCATATRYETIGSAATAIDALDRALLEVDGDLPKPMRTTAYMDVRDKAVNAIQAAAALLPIGCASSLSDEFAAAAAGAHSAVLAVANMVRTQHEATPRAAMDPASIVQLVGGGLGALVQLVQGGVTIYEGIKASRGQDVAVAQTACSTAVDRLRADVAALPDALAADDRVP